MGRAEEAAAPAREVPARTVTADSSRLTAYGPADRARAGRGKSQAPKPKSQTNPNVPMTQTLCRPSHAVHYNERTYSRFKILDCRLADVTAYGPAEPAQGAGNHKHQTPNPKQTPMSQ
jgi:hypothetical protein